MFHNEWISENIFVCDSIDCKNLILPIGHACFIIGSHVDDKVKICNISEEIIKKGYEYFCIFGEQAMLWSEILLQYGKNNPSIEIEVSKSSNKEIAYNLALATETFSELSNLVISDDFYFTEYLLEDYQDITEGRSLFSISDWKLFKQGFEFKYKNKDCIMSACDGVIIGYLGNEKRYDGFFEACRDKIFDGHSFLDIWVEIKP